MYLSLFNYQFVCQQLSVMSYVGLLFAGLNTTDDDMYEVSKENMRPVVGNEKISV